MNKTFLVFLFIGSVVFAQNDTIGIKTVGFNPDFSYKMLDQNQNLRKVNILLEERKNGAIQNNRLIIGSSLISIFDYKRSNTDKR